MDGRPPPCHRCGSTRNTMAKTHDRTGQDRNRPRPRVRYPAGRADRCAARAAAARLCGILSHVARAAFRPGGGGISDRKSTRLNSSHITISYAVFCLKKKKKKNSNKLNYRE